MEDKTMYNESYNFMEDNNVTVLSDDRHEAVKAIEGHRAHAFNLLHSASQMKISDDISCELALNVCGDIKTVHQQIEELRKKAVEPYRKVVQMINDCAKGLQKHLDDAKGNLILKLAEWQGEQKRRAEAAQESLKTLSETMGFDMEIMAPNAPKTLSSLKASTYARETLTFEIENVDLIPDEYWIVDEKMIQKHISLGKRDIPGVKIIKQKTLTVRRK